MMSQKIEALSLENSATKILCFYTNGTRFIQIIRMADMAEPSLERVVFPGQRLLFEALPEAFIEISTANLTATTITKKIQCAAIQVDEGLNVCLENMPSNRIEKVPSS
ncbi:DUF1830 domain-containing protein [Phormidium nigroviride]